jgi:MFS family permease
VAGSETTRQVITFRHLLRSNRNFRFTWTGQVISEVGDNYNNIAVFALAMANTGSGLVVAGILLARALPMMLAGPLAGVLLDRMDRRKIMITSDLVRAVIALAFVFAIPAGRTWMLYVLSGMLMFASPFFTAGRSAIMPVIASEGELHTANSLTQMTRWTSQTIGSLLGGAWIAGFGYEVAFILNAASFVLSAVCIWQLRLPAHANAGRQQIKMHTLNPWRDYTAGLRYMRATPLIFGIGLISVGWATGGGAAQILFSLFGEIVFQRGAAGIGMLWGAAGIGLVAGAVFAHSIAPRLGYESYKRTISIAYVIHGGSYVLFSQAGTFEGAMFWIGMSRAAMGVSSILNTGQLLRHVSNEYRGRVFATVESWSWTTMIVSMAIAGVASEHTSARVIGMWSGILSSTTAVWWAWANWRGHLPEPPLEGVDPDTIEMEEASPSI